MLHRTLLIAAQGTEPIAATATAPTVAAHVPLSVVIFTLVGGVGLFLLGMSLLTEGLNALGGSGLRSMLRRMTSTPGESFLAGTGMTVLMQASSATVLSTIGFVAAGLIPLAASVGLVVGATVGTSSTSWLVSVVGLSSVSFYFVMPALGAGAFMRSFMRGRWKQSGTTLAGLAVMLASIAFIGRGLSETASHISLEQFTTDTLTGQLTLCLAGLAMAVFMQSSAAPIAVSMVGVNAGSLTLDQACFVLMGATVGTTSTGIMVAFVGGLPARRIAVIWTAVSIVQFAVGMALFPVLQPAAVAVGHVLTGSSTLSPVALAAFHTLFTLAGGLPLVWASAPLARLAVRGLPAHPGEETGFELDRNVLQVPSAAVAAARQGVFEIGGQVAAAAQAYLGGAQPQMLEDRIDRCASRVESLRLAMDQIEVPEGDRQTLAVQVTSFAAVDHLARILGDMRLLLANPVDSAQWDALADYRQRALVAMNLLAAWLSAPSTDPPAAKLRDISRDLTVHRRAERRRAMERTAAGQISSESASVALEMLRQIDRMAHHAAKVAEYLANGSAHGPTSDDAAAEEHALSG